MQAIKSIYAAFTGITEVSWLVRDTLTNCDDYNCALKSLSDTQTSSKCYFILSGMKPTEGVVISKSENQVDHVDYLEDDLSNWFLR